MNLVGYLAYAVSAFGSEPFQAALVRFGADYRPAVSRVSTPSVQVGLNELGLVVWEEVDGERWQVFRGNWTRPESTARNETAWLVSSARNAQGSGTVSPNAVAQLTTQLDPLLSPSVIKAVAARRPQAFITPPDGGVVLGPWLTIRRAKEGDKPLPPVSATLSDASAAIRISFDANQAVLHVADVPNLPATWKQGLPGGQYRLRLETESDQPITFTVETGRPREQITQWLDEWQQLAGSHSPELSALVAVDYLLAQQPLPYLADTLDVLDALPDDQISPYLQQRRQLILALLTSHQEPTPPALGHDETGIAEIDRARRLIAQGRWDDALAQVDSVTDALSARSRGLANLYRGVIHAESGLGQEQAADFYFRRAIAGLEDGHVADRFRAYNNYANFLLNRTQDRVFNHAFQMACGVRALFVTALLSWEDARRRYETALEFANQLGPHEQAAVKVNMARLFAVLAEVIVTLDSPDLQRRQLRPAEQAIYAMAERYAREAAGLAQRDDLLVVPVVETLLSQLAFRERRAEDCREHARQALSGYIRSGSLAGIESIERLLGLLELRAPELAADQPAAIEPRRTALNHFRMAHLLAELLRDQVPADRVGMTRAGFFARRTYVNEQIVELLIAEGKETEALYYAELAKARALQDLLATRGRTTYLGHGRFHDFVAILDQWPDDVVALEYFLTAERAWIFVVGKTGQVNAYPLLDEQGRPLAARDLVAQVEAFLRADLDHYPVKMHQRLLAGRGLDHTWQDELHGFYRRLLPPSVLAQLQEVRTLLIVPHHILHYFPFVSLVTERDPRPRGKLEMVQPRFLIDEPCSFCYVPSLITWHMLRQRPPRPITEVSAIGIPNLPGVEPLPGVEVEIRALRETVGPLLRTVLTDHHATKAQALSLLEQRGMLLISAHGQNWPDQPLGSELLLYPTDRDKGRLTAADLYDSEVGRDLTVLSACYTALADKSPLPGDDLFGLQRALLQSGGRTVVSGQWDVCDRTGPELMQYFFFYLSQGQSAPNALAASQRRFLQRLRASNEPEPWLHPYFWAVYTVAGDDCTRFQTEG